MRAAIAANAINSRAKITFRDMAIYV